MHLFTRSSQDEVRHRPVLGVLLAGIGILDATGLEVFRNSPGDGFLLVDWYDDTALRHLEVQFLTGGVEVPRALTLVGLCRKVAQVFIGLCASHSFAGCEVAHLLVLCHVELSFYLSGTVIN